MKTAIFSFVLLGVAAVVTTSSCRNLEGSARPTAEQTIQKAQTGIELVRSNGGQCVVAVAQPIKA